MKDISTKHIIITVLVVCAAVWALRAAPTPTVVEQEPSIVGCYVVTSGNDRYELKVTSQLPEGVTGTLAFKNAEKDSSQGLFSGVYTGGVLRGTYTFTSEGMDSVMEVAFKKTPTGFVRGYGPVDETGTSFVDTTAISYDEGDPLSAFVQTPCAL